MIVKICDAGDGAVSKMPLSCGADLASQKVDTVPVVSFALHRAFHQGPTLHLPSILRLFCSTYAVEISVRVITPCTNINLSKLRSSSQP